MSQRRAREVENNAVLAKVENNESVIENARLRYEYNEDQSNSFVDVRVCCALNWKLWV